MHATQLLPHEAELLGRERAFACICATTERDLGDGLPDLSSLRSANTRLCIGIDSHVITDPFDDLRALETHERLRIRKRITFAPNGGISPAEQLWKEGSIEGANACGFLDAGGELVVRRDHPTLACSSKTTCSTRSCSAADRRPSRAWCRVSSETATIFFERVQIFLAEAIFHSFFQGA